MLTQLLRLRFRPGAEDQLIQLPLLGSLPWRVAKLMDRRRGVLLAPAVEDQLVQLPLPRGFKIAKNGSGKLLQAIYGTWRNWTDG